MIARGKIEGKSKRKYVGESGSEVGAGLASREEEEEGRENDDPGGVDSDQKFGREDGNWKDRKFVSWRERRWGCSARAETGTVPVGGELRREGEGSPGPWSVGGEP